VEDIPNIVVDENGLFLLDSLGRNIIAQELWKEINGYNFDNKSRTWKCWFNKLLHEILHKGY
jgi:hypothetical protein